MEITRLILSAIIAVAVWQNYVQIRYHRKKQKAVEDYFKAVVMQNARITCALFPTIIGDMVAAEAYRDAEKCRKVLSDAEQTLQNGVDKIKII